MDQIVYKGISSFEFFKSILYRAVCVGVIVYLILFHYEENPPVILAISIICFLVFIFLGNDEIIIYTDKVVQKYTSIIDAILRSKGKVYEIKDIKSASLPEEIRHGVAEIGIILLLAALLSSLLSRRARQNTQRRFYLDLKNGKSITILSDLGENTINEIVRKINLMI